MNGDSARYAQIVGEFAGKSVLVIGDLMVDEYLRGTARRISQESPVMVVEVESDEFMPGGAANVVSNLQALGARVSVGGVVGADEMGRLLREELVAQGLDVDGIITDETRPTTRKTRVVAQNQQVLRVDREQVHPIGHETALRLLDYCRSLVAKVDVVLLSDYRKGVLSQETVRGTQAAAARTGCPLVANAKPSSAHWLSGALAVTLNQPETEELARARLPQDETALATYGARLREELDVDTLVVTRSAKGLNYWRSDGESAHVEPHPVEVADGTGAGDTTISTLTLALVSGATMREAAELANLAGAYVVRKAGVATVSATDLLHFATHHDP